MAFQAGRVVRGGKTAPPGLNISTLRNPAKVAVSTASDRLSPTWANASSEKKALCPHPLPNLATLGPSVGSAHRAGDQRQLIWQQTWRTKGPKLASIMMYLIIGERVGQSWL